MAVDVLVVKMSSMGDVVHAQPLACDIRRQVPGARIDWVCEAPFAAIPAMNPCVDAVIPIAWRKWRRNLRDPANRRALAEFRERLRARRYDWVLDCQGLLKSAALSRFVRAAHRAGPAWGSAREPLASLAYDLRIDVPWAGHVVARNRAIGAGVFGYAIDDPPSFGLQVPGFRPDWLQHAEAGDPRPIAVLVTGASRPQKLWPEGHWLQVAQRLREEGCRLVWLWGSDAERERAITLSRADTPDSPQAASIVPPFLTVADAAGLLGSAAVVVGLDTGFTHMAGALGRSTVAIFCDFDAVQCAVSGDGHCESFGGVGHKPSAAEVGDGALRALATGRQVHRTTALESATEQ